MLFFVYLGGSHKSNHTTVPLPPYQVTLMTHWSVTIVYTILVDKLTILTKLTSYSQVIHRCSMRGDVAPIKYYFSDTIVLRVNTYLRSYPHMAVTKLCISTELSTD